tara:strand:+ start:4780 stop:5052 length:273 start_codon:yes stop_codon:yes gene_type:complete
MDDIRTSLKQYIEGNLAESAKTMNKAHLKVYEACRVYRDMPMDDCLDIMSFIKSDWPDYLKGEIKYIRTLEDMNRAIHELCLQFCTEEMG